MSSEQADDPAYESPVPSFTVEQPPSYSEYPTELPTAFPIGKANVWPLVNVSEGQAHLRLLGAFDGLRRSVVWQRCGTTLAGGYECASCLGRLREQGGP